MYQFFDLAFWQQLTVTVAGLVIGIPFALWINRRQERREEMKHQRSEITRKHQVLDALTRAIKKNRGLLKQMQDDLPTKAIFYNVELAVLEAMASEEHHVLDDVDLREKLAHLRYELSHLHRKINLQLQIEFDGALRALSLELPTPEGPRKVNAYARMRQQLVGAIVAHLNPLLKACEDALDAGSRVKSQLPVDSNTQCQEAV